MKVRSGECIVPSFQHFGCLLLTSSHDEEGGRQTADTITVAVAHRNGGESKLAVVQGDSKGKRREAERKMRWGRRQTALFFDEVAWISCNSNLATGLDSGLDGASLSSTATGQGRRLKPASGEVLGAKVRTAIDPEDGDSKLPSRPSSHSCNAELCIYEESDSIARLCIQTRLSPKSINRGAIEPRSF